MKDCLYRRVKVNDIWPDVPGQSEYLGCFKGEKGVVVAMEEKFSDPNRIGVDFGKEFKFGGQNICLRLNGAIPSNTGMWFKPGELEFLGD